MNFDFDKKSYCKRNFISPPPHSLQSPSQTNHPSPSFSSPKPDSVFKAPPPHCPQALLLRLHRRFPKLKPEPKCRKNLHPSAPPISQTPGRTHSQYQLVHSREPGFDSGNGFHLTKYHQMRREVIMQKKEKKAPALAELSLNEEEVEGRDGRDC